MIGKICPHCGNLFEGRANRTYCSTRCKSALNNARVAERDETANEVAKIVKNNRRILMQIYNIYGSIDLPSIVIKKTKLDTRWHSSLAIEGNKTLFLDYILEQLVNGDYKIYKYKNNGNLKHL